VDLFKEVVSEEKLHPNFKSIRHDVYIKEVINNWCNKFIDRDGKFIKEFQTTFNSSFWEIYCFEVFKQMNITINLNYDRPDFVLRYNQIDMNVECVIASNAEKDFPEFNLEEKIKPTISLEERVYKQTLRLLNAISYKSKLFLNKYSKLKHVKKKPFIIAIAPFDQPTFMDVALEAIHMVLYGINVDKKSFEELQFDTVYKRDDCPLRLGLFTNEDFQHISAVLFSNVATMGKVRALSNYPNAIFNQVRYNENSKKRLLSINYRSDNERYRKYAKKMAEVYKNEVDHNMYSCRKPFLEEGYTESLTDGLHLFLNPYAIHSINDEVIELIKSKQVQVHTFDTNEKTIKDIILSNGYLIQRLVDVMRVK
jgi:hypothetical protein